MQERRGKAFLPIIFLFIILNGFFLAGKNMLHRWNADQEVLITGNLFLFLITLIAFFIVQKSFTNKNPQVFIRSIYGSVMIRLFASMIAAFIYIAIFQKNLNKPALFILMGLYLLYTFVEVSLLTRMLKSKTHG
jgi:hypothetical protein